MSIELTQASADEYSRILSGEMTPAMAAEYLRGEHIVPRNFADVLHAVYDPEDLQFRLTAAFSADGESSASVSRKVYNWISGKNAPTSREDVFRIAFALDLTESQTNYLLGFCTNYGIHYRDGRDTVYAWFLRTGGSYADARAFFETLPPVPLLSDKRGESGERVTKFVRNSFLPWRIWTRQITRWRR